MARELFQRFIDEGMIGQAYCSICDIACKILIAPVDFSIIRLTFRWFSSAAPSKPNTETFGSFLLFLSETGVYWPDSMLHLPIFDYFLPLDLPDKRLKLASVDPLP